MMKHSLLLLSVLVLTSLTTTTTMSTCRQGQDEGSLSTNMKVNLRIASIQTLINRQASSYLKQTLKALFTQSPIPDQTLNGQNITHIKITEYNNQKPLVLSKNPEFPSEELILLTIPELYLKVQMKVNGGTTHTMSTSAMLEASFKVVSSQEKNWKAQLFFRQLKVTCNNNTSLTSSQLETFQTLFGRTIAKYITHNQDNLNTQLSLLEQQFFTQQYDLGLQYNYTLQPSFTEDQSEYSLNLHGSIHHNYNYYPSSPIQTHRISSQANQPSFLSIPVNTHNVTIRYLLSDYLLSSMFGAQYEVPTALNQSISLSSLNAFIQYLKLSLSLNIKVIHKLFNGVIPVQTNSTQKNTFLSSPVLISIKANDYPYFNLTKDNTIQAISPIHIAFNSQDNSPIASLTSTLKLTFTLKHDSNNLSGTFMKLSNLKITLTDISSFTNHLVPQTYQQKDIDTARRVLNGIMYIWSKGIQKTINFQGLDFTQFLPQIKVDQLTTSSSTRQMTVKKINLLKIIKGKQQMNQHNMIVNANIDITNIRASCQEIVTAIKNYIFSK